MNELEDIKLKALLKNLKLDSPKSNFSAQVMNKIYEQETGKLSIKSEKIFGKGFWIIIALFLILFVVTILISYSGITAENSLQSLFPKFNPGGISVEYQSFFKKISTAPANIALILIASSLLLFIDRIINLNSKLFAY